MSDAVRTRKRRLDAAPPTVARYGDAIGGGRRRGEAGSRGNGGFSFSSPGLALIGLRRPDRHGEAPLPPRERLA